jgi:hypothetical protein
MPSPSRAPSPARRWQNTFTKAEAVSKKLCHSRGSPQTVASNFGPERTDIFLHIYE